MSKDKPNIPHSPRMRQLQERIDTLEKSLKISRQDLKNANRLIEDLKKLVDKQQTMVQGLQDPQESLNNAMYMVEFYKELAYQNNAAMHSALGQLEQIHQMSRTHG